MKAKSFVCALLLMVAGLQLASAQEAMKVYSGGRVTVYRIESVDQVTFVKLVSEIQLSQTSVEIEKGETLQLTATVLPEDADEKELTWESSNPMAAKVDENGLVTGTGRARTNIICRATDGSDVQAVCEVKVNAEIVSGTHEYVDMGLPSGTLWATTNLGADVPEEYGFYYAWGETEPKDDYTWATYKWMTPGESHWSYVTKYTFDDGQHSGIWYDENHNFIGDGQNVLLPEDDAATVNWGVEWQTPSKAQLEELVNPENTLHEYVEYNGVWGHRYTSQFNGNSIFLPETGRYNELELETGTFYWSCDIASMYSDLGWYFNGWDFGEEGRRLGMPIRPVRK